MHRLAVAAALFLSVSWAPVASAQTSEQIAAQRVEIWRDLQTNVFDGRPMESGDGVISLEAPKRAEDAAIVPITMRVELPPDSGRRVKKITLVIDANPAPVAAEFELGENAGVTEISTRIRVDSYTNVHAVAETDDGKLYVAEAFVKASGGCSAPALKNADEALANLGQMKFRLFEPEVIFRSLREAQLMIRHPNYSGLQMDQLTRYYIPANFVRDLTVRQGDDLVLRMEGGISISEDPNFRFTFRPNGTGAISAEAIDTEENAFRGEWPVETDGAS
jgi:sulfur-oxidizing protein SoxY